MPDQSRMDQNDKRTHEMRRFSTFLNRSLTGGRPYPQPKSGLWLNCRRFSFRQRGIDRHLAAARCQQAPQIERGQRAAAGIAAVAGDKKGAPFQGDTHLPEDVMGDRTVSARGEDFSGRGDADSRHPDQRIVIRAVYLHRIHVQMPQRPCGLRVEILL